MPQIWQLPKVIPFTPSFQIPGGAFPIIRYCISGTVGFCQGSSPFSGHLCDAGKQGLLPHPNGGLWALGGLCPAPGSLAGGRGSLGRAVNLLGRNGGACKLRGGIGPPEFTAPMLGLNTLHQPHPTHLLQGLGVSLADSSSAKKKYVDCFAVCKLALLFCEWVHSPAA